MILETLRYPSVRVTGSAVEELRVREETSQVQDGEISKFLGHFKYNCEVFDSLAMLL